ncbi:integrase arm-type DNA-binding domain-containing protein, partial [Novosphingobium sp.]|uniref:tyrosine-type recombinase/integrase n=1 Tax=Novosphingobium sp. TaxID=1874826 RepID=UPI002611CB1D
MPRKLHNALTDTKVRSAGPGRHADGGGLYLRVQHGGARSWLFRMLVDGKARDVGLGPAAGAGAVSLADARKAARALAVQRDTGEVIEGKRTRARRMAAQAIATEAAARTFREVAEAYIDRKEGGWKNPKHRQQWRNTLATYAYPVIGDMPIRDVGTADVMRVLEPIWTDLPETASRVRGRLESILSAAKVQGLRSGENPALWRGHLKELLPDPRKLQRGHHAALAYAEFPAFMAELRTREAVAARALEFAILTNTRVGETIGATWAEVDLAKGLWTIPADRMKAGKPHEIPLSSRAAAILRGMLALRKTAAPETPLFPATNGKALSTMAMPMLVRRMHETATKDGSAGWIDRKQKGRPITVHGFRSTFRDWAG